MEGLSSRQRQVLLKMRNSNNPAEQLHSFYQTHYGQMHHFTRMLEYQDIAYYLYQDERKVIEQYYLNRLKQEKDAQQKTYYEKLCAFLKTFHYEVDTYEYSKEQIAQKDRQFYEKQTTQEQSSVTKIEKKQQKHSDTVSEKFSTIWKSLCRIFEKHDYSGKQYEKNKYLKKI